MSKFNRNTPLHDAVMNSDIDRVNTILEQHGSNNNQNRLGNTPLHCSFYNCVEVVEALIMKGSNVNIKNFVGETPLLVAAGSHSVSASRRLNAIRLLLDHGANVNEQDLQGHTALYKEIGSLQTRHYPLHVDFRWENEKIVKLLLEHGADINSTNSAGESALHILMSLAFYNESLLNFLLEKGADVNAVDHDLDTPLHIAASLPNTVSWKGHLVKWLLERGATSSVNACGKTPLFRAVSSNSQNVVNILLESGADVNWKNNRGMTPIAYVGGIGVFNLLVKHGADINVQDLEGKTPLHHIVENQYINTPSNVVSSFLDWGASLSIKDNSGRTPSLTQSFPDTYIKFVIRKSCVNMVLTRSDELKIKDFNLFRECYRLYCLQEVNKMKQLQFGRNTLFDIFAQINDPKFLGNDNLLECVSLSGFERYFPIYSSLMRSMCQRAKERVSLFHVAKTIIGLPLPEELVIRVLSLVDNDGLQNIIKAQYNTHD